MSVWVTHDPTRGTTSRPWKRDERSFSAAHRRDSGAQAFGLAALATESTPQFTTVCGVCLSESCSEFSSRSTRMSISNRPPSLQPSANQLSVEVQGSTPSKRVAADPTLARHRPLPPRRSMTARSGWLLLCRDRNTRPRLQRLRSPSPTLRDTSVSFALNASLKARHGAVKEQAVCPLTEGATSPKALVGQELVRKRNSRWRREGSAGVTTTKRRGG